MVAKLFAIPVFGSFKTAKPSDYIQLVLDVSIKIVEVLNLEFQNSQIPYHPGFESKHLLWKLTHKLGKTNPNPKSGYDIQP
jgi:hypothetical protein